jgi:hypothetical protein
MKGTIYNNREQIKTSAILESVGGEEWLKTCSEYIESVGPYSGDCGVKVLINFSISEPTIYSCAELNAYPVKHHNGTFKLFYRIRRKRFSTNKWIPSACVDFCPETFKRHIETMANCHLFL